MDGLNSIQVIPYWIWVMSAATGILIVLLALFMNLFYRKRLQAMEPLNTGVGDLINQKQQLEADVDSIRDWIAAQNDELQRLEAERKEQEIIRAELTRLEEEAAKRVDENKEQIDEVGKLENQRHLLVQSMEKLEKEKTEIEKGIKTLGKENENAEKALQEIEKELSKLIKEEDKLNNAIEKGNNKIEQLSDENKKLEESIKEAKEKLKDTEKQTATMEKELKEIEKQKTEKSEEVENLKNKKIDLNDSVRTLKEKLKSIGTIPKEAFESLHMPFIKDYGNTRSNVEEATALDRLYSMTSDSGFELPKRLQNAFHTALKTSDISCLTVMAGVSGTGKSAYPKLYAQSMGIHFLPLAVEPRWDSPQDLFGFLNYMENRFEATTLGRSLVQFDNSPYGLQYATMKDQVLIVLLDEMNLARIEYYFSEFLSKLEMRRNIDVKNIQDFRMVSTEIYAGSKEDTQENIPKSDPIFLHAGSNILFVGTMNEDETTQSLSDKVIDRANVIHFGKPEKLKNTRQNIVNDTNWAPITTENWRSWITEPDADTISDFDNIDQLLNDINSTLYQLGRPFGWRTYKAMMTYISNHPSVSIDNQSGLQALSDQVAMRIMPKLRGLDISENDDIFNQLRSHIESIKDNTLDEAFSHAVDSKMGFFDWRGISWE